MFKNLKQKTLNSSTTLNDASLISSRSVSSSSLADPDQIDANVSVLPNRYQSVESLSSVSEQVSTVPSGVFGNLEDIIQDLRSEITKKDAENRKLTKFNKEAERRINELVDNWNKEVEGRQALERAYEKLEDSTEVQLRDTRDKLESESKYTVQQLQNQIERLKKDNEKLSKKNSSGDAVAWQNKAESIEQAYTELLEIQEHSDIQVQKMRDLLKMKDDDLQALQNKFDETEENYKNLQLNHKPEAEEEETEAPVSSAEIETLNWKAAKNQQEIETLEKQVVKLELDLEECQQKCSDKDFRISRLREDVKNKDLLIDTQKSDATELTNALDRTSNILSDTRVELEACKNSYTKSLADLQQDIDSITAQYKECRIECRKQTELVEQLQIAASATKTLKTNLQEDLSEWQQKYEASEATSQEHLREVQNHVTTISELTQRVEELQAVEVQMSHLQQQIVELQQNEDELRQEKEYLNIARESWQQERQDMQLEAQKSAEAHADKVSALKEELELLRRSNQSTILPVSSSLQAKFVKGVTEVDLRTRREEAEGMSGMRARCSALEKELAEKTKQLKQNQQHLSDMKKTLQHELRSGGNISPSNSRMDLHKNNSPGNSRASPSLPPRTDHHSENTQLEVDNINLEYLKHCVIRLMCCLDKETSYLVRVIGVLLHFTAEEAEIVQEALKSRSSWFRQNPPSKALNKLKSTRNSPTKR